MFSDFPILFGWQERQASRTVEPWKPVAIADASDWPPNYKGVYAWRLKTLARLRADPEFLASAKAYYRTHKAEFIMHWMDTYDPRKQPNHIDPEKRGSKWMPFVFFKRQYEFIEYLEELRRDQESGLCEKSRDMGATWGACGYSVTCWLFIDGDAIGWGSRKEDLVDKIGDPDSIFEKLRLLIKRIPDVFMPKGFSWRNHSSFMKLLNPENGSIIAGEAGDNIGRGGRKSIYFKDESAHYERPELIEAALGDNTNVQIDISSVNGLGNVFHRRRKNGIDWFRGRIIEPGYTRVFVMDWRDHPAKTQQWYDLRRAKNEREGLLHKFKQEVDRDYSGAILNTIIPYEWVDACVDAHLKVPYLRMRPDELPDVWGAALDVADGGSDLNALTARQWIIWREAHEWGDRDVGVTTRRAMVEMRRHKGIKIQYDAVGMGSTVKAEYNRLVIDEKIIDPADMRLVPWNAGAKVLNPFDHVIEDDDESLLNNAMFGNFKAQAWWSMRTRCWKTFQAVTKGVVYPADQLISLDSAMPLLEKVKNELAQPTKKDDGGLRMIVDKKPDGTPSPNLADGGVMMYFPMPDDYGQVIVGTYG